MGGTQGNDEGGDEQLGRHSGGARELDGGSKRCLRGRKGWEEEGWGGGRVDDGSGADGGGSFKTMGMRKRRVEILEGGEGVMKKKKKKAGALNAYQKVCMAVAVGVAAVSRGRRNDKRTSSTNLE